ncbi:Integrase, catalytic core protein [Phytophthora megakarya]|uniref:Integrase, catalytic core protein n=1 Tax=Phytophthora megakarya TaxID=4795 RepID=A0A225WS93_9STRA|nr:Integrase, catalytic core protein [Phytophthora megakarya]
MKVPYDIPKDKNMMCRLDKAIYGLKQEASAWCKPIHRVFVKIGFRSCVADECIYVKVKEGRYMYICLYVDDMIIAAKSSEEIQEVKAALKSAFKMKDLGEAKFIIGMKINHDQRGLS